MSQQAQLIMEQPAKEMMPVEVLQSIIPDLLIPIPEDHEIESGCVDGRGGYLYSIPVRAFPGADAGLVMNGFAALNRLLPQDQTNNINFYDKVWQIGNDTVGKDKFRSHTDQAAEDSHKGSCMGCGHMRDALLSTRVEDKDNTNAEDNDYLVTNDQMEYTFKRLSDIQTTTNQVVLQGEHKERAVVLVRSEKFSLKHNIQHPTLGYREVFVYHETLHDKLLSQFSDNLANNFSLNQETVLQELKETFGIQLGKTLENLANGYPLYIVTISDDRTFTIE